jgi:hypothetical protein
VGYSDHTPGIEVPIAATALGAEIIEKHFTLDRTLPGPDHAASLEPNELKNMVSSIRNIQSALGNGVKIPSKSELKNIVECLIETFNIAGQESIDLYAKGLKIKIKEDNSPVSNGDLRANELITNKILELTPNIPVVSEETVNLKLVNGYQTYEYANHPCDLVGWDGYYFPWIFNINDFEPITGSIHQPPPVHQTFETKFTPPGMSRARGSWSANNPEYVYKFYEATDRIDFIKNNFPVSVLKAYHDIIPGAFKADLFRYCVLYIEGGVYADSDTTCLTPLDEYINKDTSLLVVRDEDRKSVV